VLVTQGLLVPDPGQPSPGFYVPTRRAQSLKTRIDVDAFRKGRILPSDVLPTLFAEKLFRCSGAATMTSQYFKPLRKSRSPSATRPTPRVPDTGFRSGHAADA